MDRTARKSRFLAIALAAAITATSLTAAAMPTEAKAQEAAPCSLLDTVLDCYSSFSTANYPKYNVAQYNKTYKNLSYRKGYSLTRTECLWSSAGIGPNGYPGTISRMKCHYSTW